MCGSSSRGAAFRSRLRSPAMSVRRAARPGASGSASAGLLAIALEAAQIVDRVAAEAVGPARDGDRGGELHRLEARRRARDVLRRGDEEETLADMLAEARIQR